MSAWRAAPLTVAYLGEGVDYLGMNRRQVSHLAKMCMNVMKVIELVLAPSVLHTENLY